MKFAFPLRIKFLNVLYNEGVMYMKEFCKWLGVSEKFAKVVVWLFIIMSMLIIFNSAFESIGLPYYKLTVENLSKDVRLWNIVDNCFARFLHGYVFNISN